MVVCMVVEIRGGDSHFIVLCCLGTMSSNWTNQKCQGVPLALEKDIRDANVSYEFVENGLGPSRPQGL